MRREELRNDGYKVQVYASQYSFLDNVRIGRTYDDGQFYALGPTGEWTRVEEGAVAPNFWVHCDTGLLNALAEALLNAGYGKKTREDGEAEPFKKMSERNDDLLGIVGSLARTMEYIMEPESKRK